MPDTYGSYLEDAIKLQAELDKGVSTEAPEPLIDREELDARIYLGTENDEEAKELVRSYVASALKKPLSAVSYEAASGSDFFQKPDASPQELMQIIKKTASWRYEPDEYDKYVGGIEKDKLSVAVEGLGLDKTAINVANLNESHKKTLEDMWERKLRTRSPKQRFMYYDKIATPELKRIAYSSLWSSEPEAVKAQIDTLHSLTDRAIALDYISTINPSIETSILEDVWYGVKGTKRSYENIKRTGERSAEYVGTKGQMSRNSALRLAEDTNLLSAIDTKKQDWKSPEARQRFLDEVLPTWQDARSNVEAGEHVFHMSGMDESRRAEEIKNLPDIFPMLVSKAQEEQKTNKEIYQIRQAIQKNFADAQIGKPGWIIRNGIPMGVDMAVAVGLSAIATPAAGGTYTWAQFSGAFADKLEFELGVDPQQADKIAMMAGVPIAAVEYMQIKGVADEVAKGFTYGFIRAYRDVGPKALAKELAKKAGEEFLEETVQSAIEKGIQASLDEMQTSEQYKDLAEEFGQDIMAAAVMMPIMIAGARGMGDVAYGGLSITNRLSKTPASDAFNGQSKSEVWAGETPDIDTIDQISELPTDAYHEYQSATDDTGKQAVLHKYGIVDLEQGTAIMDNVIQQAPGDSSVFTDFTPGSQSSMDTAVEIVGNWGLEAVVEDGLLINPDTGEASWAYIKDGKVHISSLSPDPVAHGYHEIFHSFSITPQDFSVFARELGIKKGTQLTKDMLDSIEERFADKYAESKANPQTKGIVQKVMSWLRKVVSMLPKLDLRTSDDVFQDLERRQKARNGEGSNAAKAPVATDVVQDTRFRDELLQKYPNNKEIAKTDADEIRAMLQKMLGKKLADNVEFVDKIIGDDGRIKLGRYRDQIISIVDGKGNPVDTALHEAVHAAEDMFLTDEELADLEKAEPDAEKRAEDFIKFMRGENGISAKVSRFFARLARRIRAAFGKTRQLDALYDFYDKLARGKLAKRQAGPRQTDTGFRDQTETPAFKKWFGDSKVVDEDGKPLVVYHGTGHGRFGERASRKENWRKAQADVKELRQVLALELKDALPETRLTKEGRVSVYLTQKAIDALWPSVSISQQNGLSRSDRIANRIDAHESLLGKVTAAERTEIENKVDEEISRDAEAQAEFDKKIRAKQKLLDDYRSQYSSLSESDLEADMPIRAEGPEAFVTVSGGNTDQGYLASGAYFTANEALADSYAKFGTSTDIAHVPYTYSVYLSMQNPYVAGENAENDKKVNDFVKEYWDREARYAKGDLDMLEGVRSSALRLALETFGFDGQIGDYGEGIEYVVFRPGQIKSATENTGAFDATNPDIRYRDAKQDVTNAKSAAIKSSNPEMDATMVAADRMLRGQNVSIDDVARMFPNGDYNAQTVLEAARTVAQVAREQAVNTMTVASDSKRNTAVAARALLTANRKAGVYAEKAKQRLEAVRVAAQEAELKRVAKEKKQQVRRLLEESGINPQGKGHKALAIELQDALTADSLGQLISDKALSGLSDEDMKNPVVINSFKNSAIKVLRALSGKVLTPSNRATIMTAITKMATSTAKIPNLIGQVDAIQESIKGKAIKETVADVQNAVEAILEPLRGKEASKALKALEDRSESPQVAAMAKDIAYIVNLSSEKADGLMNTAVLPLLDGDIDSDLESASRAFINQVAPHTKDMPSMDAAMTTARLLTLFADFKNKSLPDAMEALQELQMLIDDGRSPWLEEQQRRQAEHEADSSAYNSAMTNRIDKLGANKNPSLWQRMLYGVSGSIMYDGAVDAIVQFSEPGSDSRKAATKLKQLLTLGDQQAVGRQAELRKAISGFVEKYFTKAELKDMVTPNPEYAKWSNSGKEALTKAQVLNLIKQLEQKEKQDAANKWPDSPIAKQVAQLPAMRKAVGNAILGAGDFLQALPNNGFQALDEKFYSVTGMHLPFVENYWPVTIHKGPSTQFGGGLTLFRSFMKQRVLSDKAVSSDGNAFDVIQQHMQDVIQFEEMADAIVLSKNTLLNPDQLETMRLAFGTQDANTIVASLIDKMNGKPIMRGQKSKLVDSIIGVIVRKALSGNLKSILVQAFDTVSLGAETDASFWGKFLETPFSKTNSDAADIMMSYPAMIARLEEGFSFHQVEAIRNAKSWIPGSVQKIDGKLLGFPGVGDALSIRAGVGAMYRTVLEDPDIKTIADPAKRQAMAQAETMKRINTALQSPHLTDRPLAARRGGSGDALMHLFSSALTTKWQSELSSFRAAMAAHKQGEGFFKSKAGKQFVKKFLHYHMLSGAVQYAAAWAAQAVFSGGDKTENPFNDKDEALLLAFSMLTGPIQGLPFIGNMLVATASAGLDLYVPKGYPTDIQRLASESKDIVKALEQGEIDTAFMELIDMLTEALAGTKQAKKMLESYLDIKLGE